MNGEEVHENLMLAIKKLYEKDFLLIHRKCSEKSIVFRLGIYLESIFKEYDVDCEYNKNKDCIKSLPNKKYNFPDIIIHNRDKKDNNLLIIEIKTPNDTKKEDFENDYIKLTGFTKEVKYKYTHGAHIFISEIRCSIVWYSNGNIVKLETYDINRGKKTLNKAEVCNENMNKFDNWYITEKF